MLKQFFNLVRRVLLLDENTKRNQSGLKDLEEKVAELSRSTSQNFQQANLMIERLAYEIARLQDELRHSREREAEARDRLRLEIENQFLKENRQLPPAIQKTTKDYTD